MMEVAGPWTEVFGGSEGTDEPEGGDALLGSSTLTLAPLVCDSPCVRRSQPIVIASNRYEQQPRREETRVHLLVLLTQDGDSDPRTLPAWETSDKAGADVHMSSSL